MGEYVSVVFTRFDKMYEMKFSSFLAFILVLISCAQKEVSEIITIANPPEVLTVFPTSDTLPENLLRFYVQFSHSMKTINNLENIKLLDEYGNEVKGAIFQNVYELWDSEQKQLTLILDPARVKTGLVAHESLGRALQPNKHYQLVIETAEDIHSNKLKSSYVKEFSVSKADLNFPKIENWTIVAPEKDSNAPLKIIFPEMLDMLSASYRIWVVNSLNERIEGCVVIANHEKEWQFVPKEKWTKGKYFVQVSSALEDPAGNNLIGLFDHPIGSLEKREKDELYDMEFLIR